MLQLLSYYRLIGVIFLSCLSLYVNSQTIAHYSITEGDLAEVDQTIQPVYTTEEVSDELLRINYSFPGFSLYEITELSDVYSLIRMKGFGLTGTTGSPALPMHIEKIAIPDGKNIEVSCKTGNYVVLNDITIFPAQKPGTDGAFSINTFSKDEVVYSTDAFFPESTATLIQTNTYRETAIASVQICPAQYNPVTKQLRIYTELDIEIEFVNSYAKASVPSRRVSGDKSLLSNITINPNQVIAGGGFSKSSTSVPSKGYLILTVPEFEEAANTLAKWKQQLGYEVEIISGDDWTASKARDSVSNRYYHASYDLSYLTVLGDHEDIPAYYYVSNYGPPGHLWHVYSTNYYACMDGYSDYVPDMAHGRIPVQSAAQAMTIVEKVIDYEKAPPVDPDFYRKGLHAGYFQDSLCDGTSDKRYAKTTIEMFDYMTGQGFDSDLILYAEPDVKPQSFTPVFSGNTTLPEQYKKANGYAWDGDKDDIVSALNEGCLYAWHRDHGQRWGWMQPEFHIEDLDEVHNGNELPIVFSVNCGSGHFQDPEPGSICFAEAILRKAEGGAVGVVAATAETHSGHNDGLIIGMMDAIWPDPGIIPDLGAYHDAADTANSGWREPIYTMGDVMIQGLIRMTENSEQLWQDDEHFDLYHWFGDPAMRIWTEVPIAITASHQEEIGFDATSLTVTDISCGTALVTLCYNDKLQLSEWVEGGELTMTLPETIAGSNTKVTLTISKHNYIPYVADIYTQTSPVTNFIADEQQICPGDTVHFTDRTESNPIEWEWSCTPETFEFVNSTDESQNSSIVFTAPGYYTISLTTENSYGSDTMEKVDYILVNSTPDGPEVSNVTICSYDDIPTLVASGDNIRWYADEEITELVLEAETYTPEEVSEGDNMYYATQTVNQCESAGALLTLNVQPEVSIEVAWMDTVCQYDTAVFSAWRGQIKWYSDELCTDLIVEGDDLLLYNLLPGNDTVYVKNTVDGCESEVVDLTTFIKVAPPAPVAVDNYYSCDNDSMSIDVVGEMLKWYSDGVLRNLVYDGEIKKLTTPDVGESEFYVTQTVDGCESLADTLLLTIYPEPVFSLGADQVIYSGDTVSLTCSVTGNYHWFDDSEESSCLFKASAQGVGEHTCWLRLVDAHSCAYSDTIKIEVLEGWPEIIDEHISSSDVHIYPVPSQGIFNIEFTNDVPNSGNIVIADPLGRVLMIKNISEVNAGNVIEVDLNAYSDGVYHLTVQTSGYSTTYKILKTK